MAVTRRQLLTTAGVTAALAAIPATGLLLDESFGDAAVPAPDSSGIEHIVYVMMENRSFDHMLGWLPGADGRQAGLRYRDRAGRWHRTHHMRNFNDCAFHDPGHTWTAGRVEYDHGRCDGWLRAGRNDTSCIGYYTQRDLPFLGHAAPAWTVLDRYYSAVMAGTYPNRFFAHAGMTPQLDNTPRLVGVPTIWDRLEEAGVPATYYYSDLPFLALWGNKYQGISKTYPDFLADAAAGTLPAVSYLDPTHEDEKAGTTDDDHPPSDIRAGEAFLNRVYNAVRHSPNWPRTVMVVTFDEWGGFFDHVPPHYAPEANPKARLRGFRVPTLVISPYARRRHVNHGIYDHTSVLRLIEWRYGLKPLAVRDARAGNLATVLNYDGTPDLYCPTFSVPAFVPTACDPATTSEPAVTESSRLRVFAESYGWNLPT